MLRRNRLEIAMAVVLVLVAAACSDITGPRSGIDTSPVNPPKRTGVIVQGPQRSGVVNQGPQRSGIINQRPQFSGVINSGPKPGIDTSPKP